MSEIPERCHDDMAAIGADRHVAAAAAVGRRQLAARLDVPQLQRVSVERQQPPVVEEATSRRPSTGICTTVHFGRTGR
ncbi:hypothetical protein [Streptomyces sp. NPDC001787]|uniref:hypothetical protein n=1 Tax=Streptomyces sp. NPDC001787 TaxID=3154523 RepID=UPI00331B8185